MAVHDVLPIYRQNVDWPLVVSREPLR